MPYYKTPEGPAKKKRMRDYQKRTQESQGNGKPRQPAKPKKPSNGNGSGSGGGRVEYTPPRTDERWREQRRRRAESQVPQVTRDVSEWPKKLEERVSTVKKLLGVFGLGDDD